MNNAQRSSVQAPGRLCRSKFSIHYLPPMRVPTKTPKQRINSSATAGRLGIIYILFLLMAKIYALPSIFAEVERDVFEIRPPLLAVRAQEPHHQ